MPLRHFAAQHFSKLRHFFSVHFAGVEVQVIVTPGGGGGGPYPLINRGPGYYSIDPRYLTKTTKYITIKVSLNNGSEWKKHYIVETDRADFIIKVLSWIDAVKQRARIGIGTLKRVTGKVVTAFSDKDK